LFDWWFSVGKALNQLLRHFIPGSNEHLSNDRLASLFCNELPLWQRWAARQHLATCWQCRLRKDELEGRCADDFFEGYLKIRRKEKFAPRAGDGVFPQAAASDSERCSE
jgi:hypothetical protein